MPASRCSASLTCVCFSSSCASEARSWKRQPPHAGKCAHGASTRSGPGRKTSVASASAWLRLTFVTRARTRSPGSPRRTKTTKPFSRATPLPPYASDSTSSSTSSSLCTGAATGPQYLPELRVQRQEQRSPRRLGEVEVLSQVAEDLHVLAHGRPRVGPAVGLRVQALPVEEVVLDELQVRVEAQGLVVDEAPLRIRADHE